MTSGGISGIRLARSPSYENLHLPRDVQEPPLQGVTPGKGLKTLHPTPLPPQSPYKVNSRVQKTDIKEVLQNSPQKIPMRRGFRLDPPESPTTLTREPPKLQQKKPRSLRNSLELTDKPLVRRLDFDDLAPPAPSQGEDSSEGEAQDPMKNGLLTWGDHVLAKINNGIIDRTDPETLAGKQQLLMHEIDALTDEIDALQHSPGKTPQKQTLQEKQALRQKQIQELDEINDNLDAIFSHPVVQGALPSPILSQIRSFTRFCLQFTTTLLSSIENSEVELLEDTSFDAACFEREDQTFKENAQKIREKIRAPIEYEHRVKKPQQQAHEGVLKRLQLAEKKNILEIPFHKSPRTPEMKESILTKKSA